MTRDRRGANLKFPALEQCDEGKDEILGELWRLYPTGLSDGFLGANSPNLHKIK